MIPSKENVQFMVDALKADPTVGTLAEVAAGVVQLYYRPTDTAIHFWSATPGEKRIIATEVHTHRYAFLSTVLLGQFTNIRYGVESDPEGDYEVSILAADNTAGTGTITETAERVRIVSRTEEILQRGQTYHMKVSDFHETCVQKNSVTWAQQEKPAVPSPVFVLVPQAGLTGQFQQGTVAPEALAATPLWQTVDRFMAKDW